jgi:hypothetical protein
MKMKSRFNPTLPIACAISITVIIAVFELIFKTGCNIEGYPTLSVNDVISRIPRHLIIGFVVFYIINIIWPQKSLFDLLGFVFRKDSCSIIRSANQIGKNKYIGKWTEPKSRLIELPFNVDNARILLTAGLDHNSRFTHQDIAYWCERFWKLYCDLDAPKDIEKIMPILADVETQWDLFLVNTYKLEELQKLDFRTVRLPHEWFKDWLNQINAEPSRQA